ncbi:hypothetical protein [Duganella hordei]|uniref:hypothetical protein n=1 Tax=Duganella hordei TaxID=2865934 RepID=UPI0030E9CC86
MLGLDKRKTDTANKTIKVLTLIVSIISLISLVQKLFDVGLVKVAVTYIGYYRKIACAIFGWPLEIFNFHIPTALADFWTLSFICAGSYIRTENLEKARAFRDYNFSSPSIRLRAIVFFIFGFTGAGFFIPLSVLSIYTYTENDITRDALKSLAIIVCGTVFFFALNAFAPSA